MTNCSSFRFIQQCANGGFGFSEHGSLLQGEEYYQ
jgi:hypothetical protein